MQSLRALKKPRCAREVLHVLLQRNLIYTGITRGKELVVLTGQKKAMGIAVKNDRPQRRYSGLLATLKAGTPEGTRK